MTGYNTTQNQKIASRAIISALVLWLAFSGVATAEQLYVNESGWWRDGGVFNASTAPIQAAVGAAGAGDAIFVHGGNYYENVNVDKAWLTLEGEGADVVTVSAVDSGDHVFEVTANWTNLSGFMVVGATGPHKAGIYLGIADYCNLTNNTVSNNYCGIRIYYSSNNTLTNNTVSNNGDGIWLDYSSDSTLTNNTANSNNHYGIYLQSSSNNNLASNTAKENTQFDLFIHAYSDIHCNNRIENTTGSGNRPILYYNSFVTLENEDNISELILANADGSQINNVTVRGSDTLKNNGILLVITDNSNISNSNSSNNNYGIYLRSSSKYNTLTNNTANSNNDDGIYLRASSNTLTNNTANSNNNAGIRLSSSSNNTLMSNNASNNYYGIYLQSSSNNTLTSNNASSNWCGIYPESSDNNELTKNNASSNDWGIYLDRSSNNDLTGNIMSENDHNFGVHGNRLSHFIQNIDASNLVDKKPIYYWVAKRNLQIPDDAGFVGVVNSTNITVKELTLTNNSVGVLFAYTNNSRIENVTVSKNGDGIIIDCSSNNTLTGNNASSNYYGIMLSSSGNNTLTGNTASNNYCGSYPYGIHGWFSSGISLCSSSNNIISNNIANSNHRQGFYLGYSSNNNTLTNNSVLGNDYYGVYLYSSSNNTIHHNNLIDNTQNAYDTCTNTWDSGSAGNYYSDYNSTDPDGNGIGEDPYSIPGGGGSIDHFPLMQPWTDDTPQKGDLNGDDQITSADAMIALQIAVGSRQCNATTLTAADVSGDGSVTSLDALMILQAAARAIDL